jgi:hypothetical protein
MLYRNVLISCLASFLAISYMGNVISTQDVALSQGEPAIKYDGQSVRQVKRYTPIPGAVKKKNPRGLAKRTRPKDRATNQDEEFVDGDGVRILPDGTNIYKDGINVWANGTTVYPDGTTVYPDGTTVYPDGSMATSDGTPVEIEKQELSSGEGASSR